MTSQRPPRISVIVAAYNDAVRLPRAVASIMSQTFTDWELIVVDDGSTDATRSVAAALTRADSRVRAISIPHAGPGAARNAGVAIAQGEWIAILDSDDYATPTRLHRQLAFAQAHPTAGLVASHAQRVATTGRMWGTWSPGPQTIEAYRRTRDTGGVLYFVHSSVMVRRDLLLAVGGYPEDYPTGEDTALYTLRLAPHTDMLTLPEVLVFHEMDPDSVSRRLLRGMVTDMEVVRFNRRRQLEGLPTLGWYESVETIIASFSRGQRWLARRRVLATAWHLKGTAQIAEGSPLGAIRIAGASILAPEIAFSNARRLLRSARRRVPRPPVTPAPRPR